MLIGILQCGHFPQPDGFAARTYSELYANMLAGRGLKFKTWSVVDMEFPDSIRDADGWLITGSKYGAYDDMPFIASLEEFIRTAYGEGVPMVGVCFGHQIIAQALGGTVEKAESGWEIGRKDYDFGDAQLSLNAWHQDQVVTPPPEAETIAETEACKFAGFRYRGPAMSVQPHPEFDMGEVDLLLSARAPGLVPDDRIARAKADKALPVDNSAMADRIAAFFKEARHV